jgi:hypothetical protein
LKPFVCECFFDVFACDLVLESRFVAGERMEN